MEIPLTVFVLYVGIMYGGAGQMTPTGRAYTAESECRDAGEATKAGHDAIEYVCLPQQLELK